ncbi:AAA family ATPase [Georgenia sp. SUBG003]|uniref:AAA family ATPase n=1 Tax=Georgenia sp. SUBG003 TaxID=1497974 RepID=UPI003AB5C998
MRIHRLTLQAVGPFPGRHTVDLDALSAGGLFLLEGPTGAGKSTIIDAVVFALYGTVAGGESSDDRLHSDHAAAEVEPYVELTFSTGAGIYRVWRSPRFERPKRRGGGTTTQNARAKLWRLSTVDDEGEPVSAQVQEVGAELGRIVVLDRAQFTQTVVLPQGQFASFLRARPEDRRTVLQDVFGTEIYDRLQKRLAEMARTARADLERATSEVTAAASTFATCLEPDQRVPAGEAPATSTGTAVTGDVGTTVEGAGNAGTTGATAAAPGLPVREALLRAAEDLDGAALTAAAEEACARADARAARADAARESAVTAETSARQRLDAQRDLGQRIERRRTLRAEHLEPPQGRAGVETGRLRERGGRPPPHRRQRDDRLGDGQLHRVQGGERALDAGPGRGACGQRRQGRRRGGGQVRAGGEERGQGVVVPALQRLGDVRRRDRPLRPHPHHITTVGSHFPTAVRPSPRRARGRRAKMWSVRHCGPPVTGFAGRRRHGRRWPSAVRAGTRMARGSAGRRRRP